ETRRRRNRRALAHDGPARHRSPLRHGRARGTPSRTPPAKAMSANPTIALVTRVYLTARRRESGEEAVAAIKGDVHFLPLDVTELSSIESAARVLAKHADHLDVLVNNAAILLDDGGSVLDLEGDIALKTLATNTVGPLLVTQAFQPL